MVRKESGEPRAGEIAARAGALLINAASAGRRAGLAEAAPLARWLVELRDRHDVAAQSARAAGAVIHTGLLR